ncbi:hypothetical protein QP968_03535 [Corynebacterium sp. MSK041]|uniref:hypothetical protein n=1 Tax=Corynebacterium sp. MSK041 TaxID=3050194 RepID=UPI00254B3F85|nr:hypothetical protein [Corynebacterium sp. MSK041]MDK8794782.1 hypothetical protein [Corynebacterium sp. MSK041]
MTTPSPNAAYPTNASGGEQPSKKSRRLLAIAGVAVGTLTIVSALSGGGSGTNAAFSNVLLGVAFLIPSLWWFYCENADQRSLQAYQEAMKVRGQTPQLLTVSDMILLRGMDELEKPRPKNRRWRLVAALSVVLYILGTVISPDTPEGGTSREVLEENVSNNPFE